MDKALIELGFVLIGKEMGGYHRYEKDKKEQCIIWSDKTFRFMFYDLGNNPWKFWTSYDMQRYKDAEQIKRIYLMNKADFLLKFNNL